MGNFWSYLSVSVLMLTGVLMIFIILLQRGRGGGLAGAFGGAGGQSALGTKAGDVFTRVTVGLAVIWVFLACLSIYALRAGSEGRLSLPSAAAAEGDAVEGEASSPLDAPPEQPTSPVGGTGDGAEPDRETGATETAPANEDPADGPALGGADTGEQPGSGSSAPAGGDNPDGTP